MALRLSLLAGLAQPRQATNRNRRGGLELISVLYSRVIICAIVYLIAIVVVELREASIQSPEGDFLLKQSQ